MWRREKLGWRVKILTRNLIHQWVKEEEIIDQAKLKDIIVS